MADRHWLFWDAECNFFRRVIRWVKRQDIHHKFEALPYQMAPSPPMTAELYASCRLAVHVVKNNGEVLRGVRACAFVLETLGYKRAGILHFRPLSWLVETSYAIMTMSRGHAGSILIGSRRGTGENSVNSRSSKEHTNDHAT